MFDRAMVISQFTQTHLDCEGGLNILYQSVASPLRLSCGELKILTKTERFVCGGFTSNVKTVIHTPPSSTMRGFGVRSGDEECKHDENNKNAGLL